MNSGEKSASSKSWRLILWGSSLPALLAASFLYFPYCTTGPVFCPSALVLGLPCPGCGMTRALGHVTHGLFREAFAFNAIWPILLGYLVLLWIYQLLEVARGEPPKWPTYKISAVMIVILLGFWAVRLFWFFAFDDGLSKMAHDNAIARLIRLFS
jgi:hypothetical protein